MENAAITRKKITQTKLRFPEDIYGDKAKKTQTCTDAYWGERLRYPVFSFPALHSYHTSAHLVSRRDNRIRRVEDVAVRRQLGGHSPRYDEPEFIFPPMIKAPTTEQARCVEYG